MHFCGNRCGSEYKPQNRSGPVPVLAATEAFGCTSSYDSREISTGTPVALLKAAISLTKASSSDCTKYFQRSIESLAPFSGFHCAFCAQALAQSRSAGPVSAPAATAAVALPSSPRRVNVVMVSSVRFLYRSGGEPLPRIGIEQMHKAGIGFEPDLVARLESVTFPEGGDDFGAADMGDDLRLRAGRLDDVDGRLGAVVGDGEVLRPHAIDRGPAVRAAGRRRKRQPRAARPFEAGGGAGADRALEEIHRR